MLGIHHYWLFIATAIVLILTPGQDTFFILGRSIASGRPAGIAAALGISAGTIVHTGAAALGLSALLATSPYAFMAVKFAGAAYLLYIGVRALLSRSNGLSGAQPARAGNGHWPAFRQGIVTNLLNPKVALFFLALMPQFVDVSRPVLPQVAALSAITVLTGVLWWSFVVRVATTLTAVLERPRVRRRLDLTTGVALVGLAGLVAVA